MFLLPRLGLLLPVVLLGPLQVVDSSFPRPAGGRCVGGDSDDASVETDSDDASVETDDSDATPVVSDEDERDPPSRPPMRERKFRSRNARPTSIGPRQQRGRTCWLCSWVTTLVAVVDECKAMGWQELHDRLWRVLDIPADGGKNGGRPEQAYWTALGVECTRGVPHYSQLCRCLKNSRMTWVPRTEVRGRVENLPECAHQPSWSFRRRPLLAWGAATGVEVVDSQGRELQNRNIWERKKPQKMVRSEEPSQSQQEPEPAGAPSLSWERARGFLARLIPFATIPEDRDGVTPSLSSGMVAKPERVRERLPLLIVFQPASWNRIVSSNPPAGWKRSPEFQNASLEDVGAHELVLACQYTLKYRHTGIPALPVRRQTSESEREPRDEGPAHDDDTVVRMVRMKNSHGDGAPGDLWVDATMDDFVQHSEEVRVIEDMTRLPAEKAAYDSEIAAWLEICASESGNG